MNGCSTLVPRVDPMAQQDLYELLGIQRDALEQEIRSSYRRRALQVHPDKGGSEDLFHAVLTAFEVLSSRSTRQTYDAARDRGLLPKDALAAAAGRGRCQDMAQKAKAPASHRALAQLRQLLATLTREARREALQNLPTEVQQALMTFMKQEPEILPEQPQSASSNLALADASGAAGGRIGRGILRQNTSPPTYRASVFLPNLFLMSVPHPSLELVKLQLVGATRSPLRGLAWSSARTRGSAAPLSAAAHTPGSESSREVLEDWSRSGSTEEFGADLGLREACEEAEMDATQELRALTFAAIVPAYFEVRLTCTSSTSTSKSADNLTLQAPPMNILSLRMLLRIFVNRQIKGRQTSDLASALAQRDRLLEAKAEGWPALRREWMAIMQSPTEVGHRSYSAEEAANIADSAWDAGTASRARAEAKRAARNPKRRERDREVTIEQAAKAVARALKAEATAPPPKRRKQAATAVSSDQKVSNGTVLHAADSEAASLCFQSFPKG
ncbi:Chaperone protein DnaJ 2 [Symbiodinium microadriaticum]|uniref:Chaperone protein DnaJ 2 n=1 Tax=Symbiodinium microadriaticum TaxID=2951 RepID=A0A1Q9D185_SYMMI|nr:Chaperone protein DnaJ 2 [Symbiodinium microadriaticum]